MIKYKSIAILICYFGKFPWYFNYFLLSCKYNPSINFFIIADDRSFQAPLPENVKIIFKTIDEVSAIASEKLGFAINIKHAYKLCDFKPTYGLLFSDLIAGYDFWGYGDIDVIFGNIRTFITPELLENYEIISVRHDFLTGYFQLLKNDHKMINLFSNSKDYKKVLSSDIHYCFDETNFTHNEFTAEIPYAKINCEVESMMHVVCRMEACNELKAYFDFHVIEGTPGKLKWRNGELYYKNKYEIILYHLIRLKTIYNPQKTFNCVPKEFRISQAKIFSHKAE